MNKIVHKFLLARDKFMPELHLRQLEFTYSAWRPLLNIFKRFRNSEKYKVILIHFKNELDKACFSPDATYAVKI